MAANHKRADNKSLAEAGMTPLLSLIEAADPVALDEENAGLKEMEIAELIAASTTATFKGRRVSAFLLAVELTERGIAPFFRRPDAAPPEAATFKTKIVKNLKLTERHQWECLLLKSLPFKRKARGLNQSAQHIYTRLALDLPKIMRTMRTDAGVGANEATARAILQKRKRLWYCAEMCKWLPTETARFFKCMTGEALNRFQVADQLAKVKKYKRRPKCKVDDDDDADAKDDVDDKDD